jgi:hypothetical protein
VIQVSRFMFSARKSVAAATGFMLSRQFGRNWVRRRGNLAVATTLPPASTAARLVKPNLVDDAP